MSDLTDRIILVTGGTGSLGRGVVAELATGGATVIATAHRPTRDTLPGVEVEVIDLLDAQEVAPMVARISERHGRIDGVVCLVGGFAGGSFIQTDGQTWRELIELNLHSAVTTIRAVLPGMTERRHGRIITVGSRPAIDPTPNTAAYSAAKAAVIAMTRSLGRELRGTGVTANCILPSTIDTPQNRESMPRADPSKWVTPEEIGRVVRFLCSDDAGIVRGAAIPVYGDA